MSKTQEMHINSLQAYYEGKGDLFSKRKQEILSILSKHINGLTDREIMIVLGYQEGNAVRPRLTELIHDGVVEEIGNKEDPITGKHVRIVRICRNPLRPIQAEPIIQIEMAFS